MNKRNLEIFGWKEIELKLEHVILFIIFLIVLFLIIFYFLKDSKQEIEKAIELRINETKQQYQQPQQVENKTTISEPTIIEKQDLTEYEILNWDTSSFSSLCKQDYGKYRDDIDDLESHIDELEPNLEELKKQLEKIEYEVNDLQLQLEKRKAQLKNTINQCR